MNAPVTIRRAAAGASPPHDSSAAAELIREIIGERDKAWGVVTKLDVLIAKVGRDYAAAKGLYGTPPIERLRYDLGMAPSGYTAAHHGRKRVFMGKG